MRGCSGYNASCANAEQACRRPARNLPDYRFDSCQFLSGIGRELGFARNILGWTVGLISSVRRFVDDSLDSNSSRSQPAASPKLGSVQGFVAAESLKKAPGPYGFGTGILNQYTPVTEKGGSGSASAWTAIFTHGETRSPEASTRGDKLPIPDALENRTHRSP